MQPSAIPPVECLDCEDLRERTEGFGAESLEPDHAVFAGIDPATLPPILGHNVVRPRHLVVSLPTWNLVDWRGMRR